MIRAILAGLAFLAAIPAVIVATMATIAAGALIVQIPAMPPCPTEDSVNCYWSADAMGNGRGDSYVTWTVGETVITLYL